MSELTSQQRLDRLERALIELAEEVSHVGWNGSARAWARSLGEIRDDVDTIRRAEARAVEIAAAESHVARLKGVAA